MTAFAETTITDDNFIFIGTSGLGHVTPAATAPFGMVQAGPDTSESADKFVADWKHTSGYQHGDEWLWRFSQTHISGTGCLSFGDFGILPFVDGFDGATRPAKMVKPSERAKPGSYAVTLEENGATIGCEVAALSRSAIYRFTFPTGKGAKLLLDCDWGLGEPQKSGCWGRKVFSCSTEFPSATSVRAARDMWIWNDYRFCLAAEFSAPVKGRRQLRKAGDLRGDIWELDFGEVPNGVLQVRLGLSTRTPESAARNLSAEIPAFDFAGVEAKGAANWAEKLERIAFQGEKDRLLSLKAALYRTMVQPNLVSDAGEPDRYSTFSLWDTYRAAHPLYTLTCGERVADFVNSMLDQYDRQGYLPIWALGGGENHCMIGHHAVPVIVDAFLKGVEGVDWERAFAAVKNSLTVSHKPVNEGTWGLMKEDWDLYDKYGYYPFDLMRGAYGSQKVRGESVARVLECAYDDACAARFAEKLGHKEDAAFFAKRASNWKNVFDPSVGFMRGKDSKGNWREPFSPYDLGSGPWRANDFCEGNSWQYTWHVMHDPAGLMTAMGGVRPFVEKLSRLFTERPLAATDGTSHDVSGLIGQYAHGNEPSHHTIYFFSLAGRNDLAAKYVREVFDTQYFARPDGLCGNDDCGQMAAWYVFSAMGFYPFDPCGGEYVIGAPQVGKAVLGKLVVEAKGLSAENKYVKRVTLNGVELKKPVLTQREILAGGSLVFEMTAGKDTEAENAAPADELARAKNLPKIDIPDAPEGYRRPKDWKPVLYPKGLHQLAKECSADHRARAAAQMAKVDETNAKGKWKPTGKSIDSHKCPEWFIDAKLGIFVDWGLWSLASWCPYREGARLYPDWYEFRCHTDPTTRAYHEKNWGKDFKRDHFIDLFKASKFDAPKMMKVFRECGARYVVPFLKHHSGFCLWDCSFTFRDSVDQGPHRDLTKEMADACRAEGMKFGFYDSQCGEWEYPILQDDGSIKIFLEGRPDLREYTPEMEYRASGKVAVKDFVREYIVPQATEFIDKYDPDIFWGDYDWAGPADKLGGYDIAAYMYNRAEGRKEVAVNDRYGRGTPEEIKGRFTKERPRTWLRTVRGDFYTDEWGDTSECLDPEKWHPWESCSGISKAYGNHWMETEKMVMTEKEFICHFSDIVARGGNLLLLVNLDPQGAMVEHQRKRLLQIGQWLGKYGEAIYDTRIRAPFATPAVDYVQSKDGRTVYAIVKEPKAELLLECRLPRNVEITEIASGRKLDCERASRLTLVRLPPDLAKSALPFALRCKLPPPAPHALTCERMKNPVGIDVAKPRLGWKLPSTVSAQTAYEIDADGWKSGKVTSSQQVDVAWGGEPIANSARVTWRVRIWDERGKPTQWSQPATFVTALRSPADWQAKWIGPDKSTRTEGDVDGERASPAFAKTFRVKGKVARATLHVTGLGFYRAYLNGKRIGEKELDPSPTDYDKRVLYSTYVLDGALAEGENELKIELGHGWYDMRSDETWNFHDAPWRAAPRTIAQLEIEYADGSAEKVVTDGSWNQIDSSVIFDDIREGEVRGARRPEHFRVPAGTKAVEVAPPKGALEAERLPAAKVVERFAPTRIVRDAKGRWIVSFPKMMSGWVSVVFRGLKAGEEVSIRYDENLTPEGGVTDATRKGHYAKQHGKPTDRFIDIFWNAGLAKRFVKGFSEMQYDHFISSGAPEEQHEPAFVYHGFMHVVLEGYHGELKPDDIRACFVRTSFDDVGTFACSDTNLTELVAMACNSYRANFTDGIPTDCPHREKLGWTGDAWVASEFAQYFFENTASYEKWYVDVVDTLKTNGDLCCIAPTSGWGYQWGNGPVFDAVLGMVPWNLWLYRGDRRIVEKAYPALVKYLGYLKTIETSPDLVEKGLGDWNAPDRKNAPVEEYVVSCLYLRLREIAAEFAAIKGLTAESAAFADGAKRTRTALNKKHYKGQGVYVNGVQCAQAMAVMFNLAPEQEREKVAAKLVEAVEKKNGQVDFGLMGSKWVYRALTAIGRSDLAFRMLTHPTGLSPARWLGKTGTLWEDYGQGLSKCHVMFGDFAAWTMQTIVGIRPLKPGFAEIAVEPVMIEDLQWAEGSTRTPYGRVTVSWRRTGSGISVKVKIPAGTTAKVKMPSGEIHDMEPGTSTFEE